MVRVLARDTKGREFDSRPFRFRVKTLGKLFTKQFISVRSRGGDALRLGR